MEDPGYSRLAANTVALRLLYTCPLWSCEKIKIGIVASINKIKLPFDMGFNKIEKFLKIFNVFRQGAKVTENKDFS